MAATTLYNAKGEEVGSVELDEHIFGAALNAALVHQVAVSYMANQRHGNHETKTRKEVSGTGAKPYRQKGTGNARRGSMREPHMRGGGTVFGPHKRSYRQATPVKMKRAALRCMLSDRNREEELAVVDSIALDAPQTKAFRSIVDALAPGAKRPLFVTAAVNANVVRSARNLEHVEVVPASDLNALDVLKATRVVLEQEAIALLKERLS